VIKIFNEILWERLSDLERLYTIHKIDATKRLVLSIIAILEYNKGVDNEPLTYLNVYKKLVNDGNNEN